jgi:hypothetical protein
MSEFIVPSDREMNACSFVCEKLCSEFCCNGATLITVEEIKDFYEIFPIYIGFRKYSPLDKEHKTFLKNMGGEIDDYYILGDFIAGNRFRKNCLALDEDKLCRLHKIGKKPLQCRIVPFCAVYPEGLQDFVFMEQRKVKFARCEGYKDSSFTDSIVWKDGSFTEPALRNAFYDFQRGFKKQSSIMKDILLTIYKEDFFKDFLEGEGILEMPIPIPLLFDILEAAGFADDESIKFIIAQTRICQKELEDESTQNTVIEDWFMELNELTRTYMEFLQGNKE